MRIIKFRAWHKEKMYSVNTLGMNNDGIHKSMSFAHKNDQNEGIKDGDCVIFNIHTEFMQFTGLTDKNGKEIYEGDIIARTTFADRYVIFENGGFKTRSINNWKFIVDINIDEFDVVIGNIYQNPELLKS